MIAAHKDWVVKRWLQRVNSEPELIRVNLSDAERQDHVPDLLDEILAHACEYPIQIEQRQKAAERHGTLRYHQGYSVPMLILERNCSITVLRSVSNYISTKSTRQR